MPEHIQDRLRNLLINAYGWAWNQLLRRCDHWLGMSAAYKRALLAASRRLEAFGLVCSQKQYEWKDLEVSCNDPKLMYAHVHRRLWEPDGLFQSRQVIFPGFGGSFSIENPELTVFRSLPIRTLLRGGQFYCGRTGQWEWRPEMGGALLPGLIDVGEARALSQLWDLLVSGTMRKRRAMLCQQVAHANGGTIPLSILPLVPVGIGDCLSYAQAFEATEGNGLDALFDVKGLFIYHAPVRLAALPWTCGQFRGHWKFVRQYPSLAFPDGGLRPLALIRRSWMYFSEKRDPLTLEHFT